MPDICAQKAALRHHLLQQRAGMPAERRKAAGEALCRQLAAHPLFCGADQILGYVPVRGEPLLLPLLEQALRQGKTVAFPRCVGTQMQFHVVSSLDDLLPGRFGIPAPSPDAPLATITDKTLCLLPGLAAGRDGSRLGYGGGFYDRFLDTYAGKAIFPIYDSFVFSTLPTESTDHRVTCVVTEKGEIPISCPI